MPVPAPTTDPVPANYLQAWKSAIAMDNAEHAAELLQDPRANGWGPRSVGGTDGSLLVRAAGEGAAQVVRLLMPLSDLNQVDSDGLSALMRAAKGGHVAVINALLASLPAPSAETSGGLPVPAPDGQGDLLARVSTGEPLNLLIQDHEHHRTALHWAAYNGHVGAVKALLPHLPASTPSSLNTLALHDAADDGEVRVIDLLLPGGTNHQDEAGWTPIMYAAINLRREAVERLAPLTDLTLRNADGQTALDLARLRGETTNVRLLEGETQRQEAAALRRTLDEVPVEPAAPRARL